jgi:hypothetical protein
MLGESKMQIKIKRKNGKLKCVRERKKKERAGEKEQV